MMLIFIILQHFQHGNQRYSLSMAFFKHYVIYLHYLIHNAIFKLLMKKTKSSQKCLIIQISEC